MMRLDKYVADARWIKQFSEEQVRHISMAASDHCLLALFLKKKRSSKLAKKRFLFEAMWVKDGGCREVIESIWDSSQANPYKCLTDKISKCQSQLRLWNQMSFGNVNTRLKLLKEKLQLIEGQNLLHETTNEIQALKKEINETLVREEVMWNQKSRALWLKCGDRNTRFFHTIASQRRRRNRIDGLMDNGVWYDSFEDLERVILEYFSSIYSTDRLASFKASLNAVA
ncbi:uncharacterized protein LOC142617137 [Castanea sativa]|uniref:uncharacterized protein LOC142617137 n=1 Tax=Castanea sativa TaxID=21020 RepID=UPI003F6537A4